MIIEKYIVYLNLEKFKKLTKLVINKSIFEQEINKKKAQCKRKPKNNIRIWYIKIWYTKNPMEKKSPNLVVCINLSHKSQNFFQCL